MRKAFSLNGLAQIAACSALLVTAGVTVACAQSGGPAGAGPPASDRLKSVKITMNAEQENLVDAIRDLMKSAKADFVIDEDFKGGTATVHFKEVPFSDALATLVKVSTLPISFEIKDEIYHFKKRVDPPPAEKQPQPPAAEASRTHTARLPVDQISSRAALNKLTGPYDQAPPMIYSHSTRPGSIGGASSFGLNGNGLLQSSSFHINPDGSISRSSLPPINVFGLLRGLLGGR